MSTVVAAAIVVASLSSPKHAAAAPVPIDPSTPRKIVQFTRFDRRLPHRLAAVGVRHVRFFPSLKAAAVIGSTKAYADIASWRDVRAVVEDAPFRTYMSQANQTTRVDQVRAGVKPLKTPYLGRNVTVAVVDTGVDTTHPDLRGQVLRNFDFTTSAIFHPIESDPANPDTWKPIVRKPKQTAIGTDTEPHGTYLAGIVAGRGRAALGSDDMRGVAPAATLLNLDVSNSAGIAPMSSLLAAFEWIAKHHDDPAYPGGIRVAVAGVGSRCDNPIVCEMPTLRAAVQRVIDRGVVTTFPAAGAADGDITYPARYPEILAAKGACKDQDNWSHRAPFEWAGAPAVGPAAQLCGSDRAFGPEGGTTLDVIAPAVDIFVPTPRAFAGLGQYPGWRAPTPGAPDPVAEANNRFWYAQMISHSFAAAHVAGIAALMLEAKPCLSPAQVQSLLRATARDLGPKGFDATTGGGMADALNAIAAAEKHRC